jgi:hypothetical protein
MDGSRKRRQEELADALDQLRGFICMDTDFVAVDINGAQHSLSYWGVYVTSRRETEAEGLWRISAGYDPDTAEAIKKDGDPAETTEFRVTDAEHHWALNAGVIDEVDGQDPPSVRLGRCFAQPPIEGRGARAPDTGNCGMLPAARGT